MQQQMLLLHTHSLSLLQVFSSCFLRKPPTWNRCFPEGNINQGRAALQKPNEKTPQAHHTLLDTFLRN